MAVFTALKVRIFTLLYQNAGGVRMTVQKRNLAQKLSYPYYLKLCKKFLEILFVAFELGVSIQSPFVSVNKLEQSSKNNQFTSTFDLRVLSLHLQQSLHLL